MVPTIKSLFQEYKWVALASIFLAIAACSWNISGKVSANEYMAERLRLLNATIQAYKDNDDLKNRIDKTLQEALAQDRIEIQKATREAVNEVLTDPVYKSCLVTNGVRESYKAAISSQSGARKSTGVVPAPKRAAVR